MAIAEDVSQPGANGRFDWDLDGITASLRQIRRESLSVRRRLHSPVKLPLRRSLESIVERLTGALFPNRLSARTLNDQSVDYFVGQTLDSAFRDLVDELVREFQFFDAEPGQLYRDRDKAVDLVREFARALPEIRRLIDTDILAAYESDPAARSIDEVLACYPGIVAITHHRLAHALYVLGAPLVARIMAEIAHSNTGIDIHPGARIGSRFFIDHGTGVVIGETAELGERVTLHHAVTLGARRLAVVEDREATRRDARHPIVEDDVVIYAGATLLGPIRIGRGSVIGGNVWLTRSLPPGSHVSQAKVISEAYVEGSGI
jgi:serine O-acetyltransferase